VIPKFLSNTATIVSKHQRGSLRIIAGRWKRQTIRFAGPDDLRPTPNAVRETLFNWLTPVIKNATCLDLFAGSGALGFEAASRGAGRVDLVDHDRSVYRQLVSTRDTLSANQAHIHCEDALAFLSTTAYGFDIVFLDPPFRSRFTAKIITALERSSALKRQSLVYLETHKQYGEPKLPETWHLYREKKTGQVAYRLYELDDRNP
jgi:16S rRNA (guanine966-N2)-methyltransferase